jgi:hypothetical protein
MYIFLCLVVLWAGSRDNSVDIATGYGLDLRRPISTESGPDLGPAQWVRGELSPGVKLQRRESDHCPPSNAEVKNGGGVPPLPAYTLMASYLNNDNDNMYLIWSTLIV